jgi:hypothetical protein
MVRRADFEHDVNVNLFPPHGLDPGLRELREPKFSEFLGCHTRYLGLRFPPQSKEPTTRKRRPFDLMTESLNVGRDGRADISVLEPDCLALQVQGPA